MLYPRRAQQKLLRRKTKIKLLDVLTVILKEKARSSPEQHNLSNKKHLFMLNSGVHLSMGFFSIMTLVLKRSEKEKAKARNAKVKQSKESYKNKEKEHIEEKKSKEKCGNANGKREKMVKMVKKK